MRSTLFLHDARDFNALHDQHEFEMKHVFLVFRKSDEPEKKMKRNENRRTRAQYTPFVSNVQLTY